MKPLGILCTVLSEDGEEAFAIVNPERMLFIVPPDQCPDDWLELMRAAQSNASLTPLGVIIDGGPA